MLLCGMCDLALLEAGDLKRAGVAARVPLPDVDSEILHAFYDDVGAEAEYHHWPDVPDDGDLYDEPRDH
jgi:hypothetical protein